MNKFSFIKVRIEKMTNFDLILTSYGFFVILVMVYIAYKGDKKK